MGALAGVATGVGRDTLRAFVVRRMPAGGSDRIWRREGLRNLLQLNLVVGEATYTS